MSSFFLSLCLVPALLAQSNINGEIVADQGEDVSRYMVEVIPISNMSLPSERIPVGPNGRFEARSGGGGTYQFRVIDERGNVVTTTTLNASNQFGIVEIRLPRLRKAAPVGSGPVSLKSLRADPDGKAEWELYQALWDVKQKNWKGAEKHFQKALKADEAHERAAANFAALEIQLGQPAKAEGIARAALTHNPKSPRLRHALGASLAAQQIYSDETIESFLAAGELTPKTFVAAAQLELTRGHLSKAKAIAQTYLRTNDKELRDVAEKITALPDTQQ